MTPINNLLWFPFGNPGFIPNPWGIPFEKAARKLLRTNILGDDALIQCRFSKSSRSKLSTCSFAVLGSNPQMIPTVDAQPPKTADFLFSTPPPQEWTPIEMTLR